MKKLTIIALFVIAAASFASGQDKQAEPFEKTNGEARQVVRYMNDWAELSNKREVAALDKLLPADLVITFQDGEVLTKAEYIAQLKASLAAFTITYYDQKVDLYNDKTAVLRARYVVQVSPDARLEFRSTSTFLKRKGKWEIVAFHSSPLTKK